MEVAADRLEGVAFLVDLWRRPEAKPAEERHRRTPTLDGMLQQEARHRGREKKPPAVHGGAKGEADEAGDGRIGFQRPLDVPLTIQLRQALVDCGRPGCGHAGNVLLRLVTDL